MDERQFALTRGGQTDACVPYLAASCFSVSSEFLSVRGRKFALFSIGLTEVWGGVILGWNAIRSLMTSQYCNVKYLGPEFGIIPGLEIRATIGSNYSNTDFAFRWLAVCGWSWSRDTYALPAHNAIIATSIDHTTEDIYGKEKTCKVHS